MYILYAHQVLSMRFVTSERFAGDKYCKTFYARSCNGFGACTKLSTRRSLFIGRYQTCTTCSTLPLTHAERENN